MVQQRAVKMISGLKEIEYEDRLKELGLTTLEERRHKADMAMVYKVLTGKEQVDPTEWFSMAGEAARATRATADPLEVRQNFFTVRVTEQWNQVPTDIKNMRTIEAFKNICPPRWKLCPVFFSKPARLQSKYQRGQLINDAPQEVQLGHAGLHYKYK